MAYTIKVLSKDISIQDERLCVSAQVQLMDGLTIVAGPQTVLAEVNRRNPDAKAYIKSQLIDGIKTWKKKLVIENVAKQLLSTLETEIEKEV